MERKIIKFRDKIPAPHQLFFVLYIVNSNESKLYPAVLTGLTTPDKISDVLIMFSEKGETIFAKSEKINTEKILEWSPMFSDTKSYTIQYEIESIY